MSSNETTPFKRDSVIKLRRVLNLWRGGKTTYDCATVNRPQSLKPLKDDQSVMFLGRKLSRKDVQPNSVEDITITAQRLCEEYIEARLARSGLKDYDQDRSETSTEYSNVFQNMGQILEMKYPRLYTKLSVHLKLNYNSEIVVWDSFNKFGGHLFSEGVSWAKVIAFYAFTGGLALDTVTYGKNELPGRMVYWFGVFFSKHIASWIKERGGWVSYTNIISYFLFGWKERMLKGTSTVISLNPHTYNNFA